MADQAERLRSIATERGPLQNTRMENFLRIIAVASGKGGVGKTNLVVNMGIIMGQLGHKILILDTDLGMANTDILMNLKPAYTLIDVIKGYKNLQDVILKGPHNVELLPGGSCLSELINLDNQQREQLFSKISHLDHDKNILLVDCSAGISRDVLHFIASSHDLVMVATPEPTAITDAYGIIKVINNYGLKPRISLVMNMVHHLKEGEAAYQRISNVCRKFLNIEINFLGSLENDEHVKKAVLNCYPYVLQFPRSRATMLTREITSRLLFDEKKHLRIKEEKFLRRLFMIWNNGSEG